MRVIIIDDEVSARNVLEKLLSKTNPEVEVVALCENLEKGVDAIKIYKPDIVFVDVEMPFYPGYEIVKFFPTIDFKIIFATAYNKYAVKAFELSAVDYLLKPINRNRLREAVEKAKNQIQQEKASIEYQVLLEAIQEQEISKIVIPEKQGKRVMYLKDIVAFEAQRSYSCIHIKDNEKITVSKPLSYFADLLPEGHQFYRPHKSWLININEIESWDRSEAIIVLSNGLGAKISKVKFSEFNQLLQNL